MTTLCQLVGMLSLYTVAVASRLTYSAFSCGHESTFATLECNHLVQMMLSSGYLILTSQSNSLYSYDQIE